MPLAPHFAALADIHGNADALRAVLADIDARAIPRAVNLGDVFSGPLALDLILSKTAAAAKNRQDDEVTGAADAIVVPDLVSGNVLFKALVYFRSACAAGVVLGGLVPIVLTSRADPPEARLASLALANILARPTSSS